MPTKMTFKRVQMYLDAIANNPRDVGDISISPHGSFWQGQYANFVNGLVPNVKCNNAPIPIINKADPTHSAFFVILSNPGNFCTNPMIGQMPAGGPFITDANYTVTLSDGSTVTGDQIRRDLLDWLSNGFPE